MYYKPTYYIKCSTTKYYEGEQVQIKAKEKSMSKHTIVLYTINYRVIIIKNSNGQNRSKCVRLDCFPHENKTKPKKHDQEYDHKNTHVVCIDKSIFVNTTIYIYQQLTQYSISHCRFTFQ